MFPSSVVKIIKNFFLHYGDITDSILIFNLIKDIQPDEVYNLAAQSHVAVSFKIPEYTANVDAVGCLRILEAIKRTNKKIKFNLLYDQNNSLQKKIKIEHLSRETY